MKKVQGDKIRWGIIGVGDVCEVKSAPAMQIIDNSELVAVMRRNGALAEDYARRHNVSRWYDNAEDLIKDPDVNAIYIATPPNAHAEYTVKAAKAGKAVYVEKPMARTTDECQEMIDACIKCRVPLYVAYYRRRLPNFEKLKSLIEKGAIGEIRSVKIDFQKTLDPDVVAKITSKTQPNWRIDPEIAGGGYFFDLAAHQLDYLDYLFGPIQSVNGIAGNQAGKYKAADIIHGIFQFENGIIGSGNWCFTVDAVSAKDEMVIIGSEGELRIEFFGTPKIYMKNSNLNSAETFEFEMPRHIQYPLIQTVVHDLLGTGTCPSTGESAIRTNRVMQEMTKNYYS